MKKTTFYPLRDSSDVTVEVKIEGSCDSLVRKSNCPECLERAERKGIIQLVRCGVNWAEIQTVDLEKIVRVEHVTFCCFYRVFIHSLG